jgi:hypothetical protein
MEALIPKLGTERNYIKKRVSQKILRQQKELRACFSPQNASERNSESLLLFLSRGMDIRDVFSLTEISERISESFLSAEQPELRQNRQIVPSIPSSAE